MSSATLVSEFRQLNADLTGLAQRDLEAFWATLDKANVAVARDALIEFSTALVDTYGSTSALIASTFYDDMRALSPNAVGKFSAVMADTPPASAIVETVHWAVGPLAAEEPNASAALSNMSGAMQKYISQPGRDTIDMNVRRDPGKPSYARVPRGLHPCDFCLMIASQGAAYSESGANAHYHDNCNCVPTAIWPGDAYPKGYDPEALLKDFQKRRPANPISTPSSKTRAASKAGTRSAVTSETATKQIAAAREEWLAGNLTREQYDAARAKALGR